MRNLWIVKRGCEERMAVLKEAFAAEIGSDFLWDRRVGERRARIPVHTDDERRRRDRRGHPPNSWTLLDFLIVEATE